MMPRLGCAGEKGWPRVRPWTDLHLQHVAAVQGPGSAAFSADFRAADWLLQALRGVSCRPVQRCAAKTFPTKWAQIPSTVTDSVGRLLSKSLADFRRASSATFFLASSNQAESTEERFGIFSHASCLIQTHKTIKIHKGTPRSSKDGTRGKFGRIGPPESKTAAEYGRN